MTRPAFGRSSRTGHTPAASDGLVYECNECQGPSDFTHLCQTCRVGAYGEGPLADGSCPCPVCQSELIGIVPCVRGAGT